MSATPASGPSRPTLLLLGGGVAVLVAAIIVVAIVLSSSGGSGGPAVSSSWIQKADAICNQFAPQLTADLASGNATDAVAQFRKGLRQILALGLPSKGAGQVKSLERQERQALGLLEQALAVRSSDPAKYQADIQQGEAQALAASAAAGKLGSSACSGA